MFNSSGPYAKRFSRICTYINYFRIPVLETLDLAGRTWILVYVFGFKVYKMQPKSKVMEEKHHIYPFSPFYFRVIVIKIHKIIHNHSFPINSSLLFSVILCQLFKEQNNYVMFFCAPPFLREPLSYLSRPCGSSKPFSLLPCLLPF